MNLIGSGGCSPTFRNSARRKCVSGSVILYLPHANGFGTKIGDVACISFRDSNSPTVIAFPTSPSAVTCRGSVIVLIVPNKRLEGFLTLRK